MAARVARLRDQHSGRASKDQPGGTPGDRNEPRPTSQYPRLCLGCAQIPSGFATVSLLLAAGLWSLDDRLLVANLHGQGTRVLHAGNGMDRYDPHTREFRWID